MKFIWDNIYLTRDERSQKIVLITLFLLLIIGKFFVVRFYEPTHTPVESHVLDSIRQINILEEESKKYAFTNEKKENNPLKKTLQTPKNQEYKLFHFDPNTISRDSLKHLGLSSYAINSLLKYRSKGGKIRSIEQMSKVNGLKEETLERLVPYITLSKRQKKAYAEKKPFRDSTSRPNIEYKKKYKQYQKKNPKIFEINTGDTTDFRNLYGIGAVYSKRIIKYRNSLGGFFNIEQINEVWGIEDSLYNAIKPYLQVDPSLITKRNINNMDRDSLNKHPYINWKKSKTIIAYRNAHGDYQSMDDFYKLHLLEDEFVDTLKHYFSVK